MKTFIFLLSLLFGFTLKAEVSRSPAVIGGMCDLDIPLTKPLKKSEKIFTQEISHKVFIHSDDSFGCSAMPKKRYPNSTYQEYAKNEMNVLFQKYPENYSEQCNKYWKSLNLRSADFSCAGPSIVSISLVEFGCEKKIEDGTHKVSFVGFSNTTIKYQQKGIRIVEKTVEVVQKEQCARVNECIQQASENDLFALKKLSAIACKADLTPVSPSRAPAIEKDTSFDGERMPKTNSIRDDQQKHVESSGSVLK